MGKLRWLILGIVSFFSLVLAHGSWVNRVLAVVLCGLLGADSGLCMATAAKVSGKAVGIQTEVVHKDDLQQRYGELFDTVPAVPVPNQPFSPGVNTSTNLEGLWLYSVYERDWFSRPLASSVIEVNNTRPGYGTVSLCEGYCNIGTYDSFLQTGNSCCHRYYSCVFCYIKSHSS
ncbi:hypothetical protein BI308_17205 [Roseofilum reptotaenium AO1-A]|uniref:Uncharacterized protein n=1 Tax=Roseofilum reptotaenium AO1-A TaxID=1925591 RepID=A0A1L9QNR4_9CYAN|nr:hypothetical protein BI308_17205 [Roseofilum reptotaenium AO1-A]